MSETLNPRLASLESIERNIYELGETIASKVMLVGSAAMYAALGNATRTPNDIDLSVPEPIFRYLRAQPEWKQREVSEDPGVHLYNGDFDVSLGWNEQHHTNLLARSWQTPGSIAVAGLADVYRWKQHRNTEKDQSDTAAMRQRLQDPSQPPLPMSIMPDEVRRVKAILPEWLHDHPDASAAIWIAANGLMSVFTQYGHPDIGKANQIIGTLELPEYNAIALYHNGFDLEDDARVLMQQLQKTHAPAIDYFIALMAETYGDLVYGNGRKQHHPDGKNYDEWLAALLLEAHTRMAGFSEAEANRSRRSVQGTTYNESSFQQEGTDDPDPVVRAVTGVDRQGFSQPGAVIRSCDLAIEDNTSARHSPDRILGRLFAEAGVRISSTEQALQQIDEAPDAYPTGASPLQTAMSVYAKFLAGSAMLYEPANGIYKPPHDWQFDNPAMRHEHAKKFHELSTRLLTEDKRKKITALQSYEIAHEHARELQAA